MGRWLAGRLMKELGQSPSYEYISPFIPSHFWRRSEEEYLVAKYQ